MGDPAVFGCVLPDPVSLLFPTGVSFRFGMHRKKTLSASARALESTSFSTTSLVDDDSEW